PFATGANIAGPGLPYHTGQGKLFRMHLHAFMDEQHRSAEDFPQIMQALRDGDVRRPHLPSSDGNGELDKVVGEYEKLGFPCAMGSTDVTHIAWSRCPYNQARSYTGKEGKPTVWYQVTVNHTGRVLAVTEGFTGSTNDKTIICWDAAVDQIRRDKQDTEKKFDVYKADGTTQTLEGCYLIVDNGYHKWRTLIEPTKYPITEEDIRFSGRLESVRKDVECFFGILKARFRILKLAMTYQKQERLDYVFFTCCILHNMLHTYDGMDNLEENVNW
ncbi:unnamed protein product, partial [Pylaiella littoralis]